VEEEVDVTLLPSQEVEAAKRSLTFKGKLVEFLQAIIYLTVPTDYAEVMNAIERANDPGIVVQKLVQYAGMMGLIMPTGVITMLRSAINTKPLEVGSRQGSTRPLRLDQPMRRWS
jgi:hypothetical protein